MRRFFFFLLILTGTLAADPATKTLTQAGVHLTYPSILHLSNGKKELQEMRDRGRDALKIDKSKVAKQTSAQMVLTMKKFGAPENPSMMLAVEYSEGTKLSGTEYARLNKQKLEQKAPGVKVKPPSVVKLGANRYVSMDYEMPTELGPMRVYGFFAFDSQRHRGYTFGIYDPTGSNLPMFKKILASATFEGGFVPAP